MKIHHIILIVALLASVIFALTTNIKAHGADFRYVGNGVSVMKGEILEGDGEKAIKFLKANPSRVLYLNSIGGYVNEAVEMGRHFSKNRNLSVRVHEKDRCQSSCALALLGASKYKIDGTLEFHIPRLDPNFKATESKYVMGQKAGAFLLFYIMTQGFHSDLAYAINNYTNNKTFLRLTQEDLIHLYVGNMDRSMWQFVGERRIDDKWTIERLWTYK